MLKRMGLAALCLTMSATTGSADVSGTWRASQDGNWLDVAIEPSGEALCGRVLNVSEGVDAAIEGTTILKDMSGSDAAGFSGGQICAPDRGKWFRSTMKLNANGTLNVAGCVAGGLICRSQTWVRR